MVRFLVFVGVGFALGLAAYSYAIWSVDVAAWSVEERGGQLGSGLIGALFGTFAAIFDAGRQP
jgi:hypothetical protein